MIDLEKDLFQFHKVRLKVILKSIATEVTEFQFHKVRLKA